jgi:hypothetical protein
MSILKNEDEMKNEFFKVIRREYKDMGWAKSNEGKPQEYTQEGYPDFLIEGIQDYLDGGGNVIDAIIHEIKENEIVMNSVEKDDPERAKYIQDFINELKALMA